MSNVKFLVVGDVKAPKRAAGYDAGVDVFVPNMSEQFMKDLVEKNPGQPYRWGIVGVPPEDPASPKQNEGLYIYVAPGKDILIPTYLKARIPSNMYLRCANKSGVCTKQKLIVGADTIDSSYEGVMHVHLINPSSSMQFIEFGQSIAQLIPEIIDSDEIEVQYDDTLREGLAKTTSAEAYSKMSFETAEKFYEGHESKRKDKGFGEGNAHDKR